MGNCLPLFNSSESTTVEPSLPTPGDPMRPPPVDPSLPISGYPVPPSLIDAIESIGEMYKKIDSESVDLLICFIETQLGKMNNLSEAGSSSSDGWLATVHDATTFAAKTIDIISTEAEKLSKSYAVEEMGSVMINVMKGIGELHWGFIGLSIAAFAVESYIGISSIKNECKDLLLKIFDLAKDIKQFGEQMPDKREKACDAVGTIVEGAVVCLGYLKIGKFSRFWSATKAASQVEKTNQQIRDVTSSFALCSLQRHWDKDVFLSHSGKQKNFVRQLYVDLERENVSCFFDEDRNSLPLAEKFPRLIFKAAETCKIAVAVISKEFICSKWPMQELCAFVKAIKSEKNANLKLLRIFFMISPKELSQMSEDSPEWQKLEVSNGTRGEWCDALKVVRSINGLTLGEDGNEVELRDKVVKEICCSLGRVEDPMLLEFKPVGIENQVLEVEAMLDMEGTESALAVILYGFGGVGKSTLAASVVHSLKWSSTDFKLCRVAIDEKTSDKTSHIINLQKHILYVLRGVEVGLRDTLDGRHMIKQALESKCCLLFIDNVIDKAYIKDLLPQNLFPTEQKTKLGTEQKTKLRIIITSRENNLKAELKIVWKEYEVRGLSDEASKRLLAETIMPSQVVENIYVFEEEERMINEVAAECRGVPLLLSVFGKHLSVERNKESYQEALDVLREGNLNSYRDEDLDTTLMFVYNKIKDVEVKEAFLDICINFHGWKWNLVDDIVDSHQLKDLHRRALVSKSRSGEVIVHDILRFMGMKEARLTRFSNYEELSHALDDNLVGSENVKGISLLTDNRLITIRSTQLEGMHQSLRVLMLGDWVTLDGLPCHTVFRNLRYLRVGDITAFPLEDPSKLDKLRVLVNKSKPGMNLCHLPSSLKRIYHEVPHLEYFKFVELPFQNLTSLKSFIVKTQKSVELSEELHFPASLVDLNINGCKNLPKDISYITALESLILDRSDLEYLPQGYGELKKLKNLSMDYCSKLASLSEELGMLSSLEALSVNGCRNLRALPESLGELISLQTLNISECINLQVLPESFGKLCLQRLNLHSLFNLHELPKNFGKMPLLKDLSLLSCDSLMSLPDSFVELKMLETLEIIECSNLSVLPEDFCLLRCLKHMTVQECHLLKTLPHGFGALPALKTLTLRLCNSFGDLPKDFTELTSLEELSLYRLPLMSRFPDGLGKLTKIRFLNVKSCFQLKTLSDDFENMATLERLSIMYCSELDGSTMEKIVKLPNCYMTKINGSRKLLEKWKNMQGKTEHPIVVLSGEHERDRGHAVRVALLNGKCMEVKNGSDKLIERSSLLVGLEEGTTATVALIMLPIHIQSHQHRILKQFVDMARERSETNGSCNLQIACAKKVQLFAERPTATEEEERTAEEDGIRQILKTLPDGSCAIPSSETKRVKILTKCFEYYLFKELSFFIANVGIDIEGRQNFKNFKFIEEDEISGNVPSSLTSPLEMRKKENKYYNSIQNFIKFICPQIEYGEEGDEQSQSQFVAEECQTRKFVEALRGNGIHYLSIRNNRSKVMVDDLHGKAIGFIICDFKFWECIKLEQIYKDLQQKDSNFIWIWVPSAWPEDCGHGSYTRLIECMPWATFPHPQLVNVEDTKPCFVVLDKVGHIANPDALPWLLAWGVKSYPFTHHTIPNSFSLLESESCLEFLLQGMNIVSFTTLISLFQRKTFSDPDIQHA